MRPSADEGNGLDGPVTGLDVRVVERPPDAVLIEVSGELDLLTVPEFAARVDRVVARRRRVVLDLDKVGFCGAAGVRELVRASAAAREAGAGLLVAGASPVVHRVVDLCGAAAALTWAE